MKVLTEEALKFLMKPTMGAHGGWLLRASILLSLWTLVIVGLFQHHTGSILASQHARDRVIYERMQQYEAERQRNLDLISELLGRVSLDSADKGQRHAIADGVEEGRVWSHATDREVESPREAHTVPRKEDGAEPRAAPRGAEASQEARDATVAGGARARKLGVGFLNAGTTASGVACYTFAGSTAVEKDLNSDNCRDTNKVCSGCFLATADANDKVLEIIKCSTAKYKVGDAISAATSTPDLVEITIINSDPDNTVTIKGCDDATCSSPVSTYILSASSVVVGYCYQGGSNAIYFNQLGEGSAPEFSTVTVGTGGIIISGTKVVGAQLSGITLVSSSAEYEPAINNLIYRLQDHGLIADINTR